MAYENFTTYTEVDPGDDITITTTLVSFSALINDTDSYVYKDFGAGSFATDFIHIFEAELTSKSNSCSNVWWAVSTTFGDTDAVITDDAFRIVNTYAGSPQFRIQGYEDGVNIFDDLSAVMALGTCYFFTVTHDRNGGGSNAGRVTVYIRTGSHEGPLFDTITGDATVQKTYQYLTTVATLGRLGDASLVGYTQNLDLQSTAGDYEDFTTYTQVDDDNKTVVSATTVIATNMRRDGTGYVYKDFGVDYFDGDFTHLFEANHSNTDVSGLAAVYELTNDIDQLTPLITDDKNLVSIYFSGTVLLYVNLIDTGVQNSDSAAIAEDTLYYITVIRDDDGGTNNTGRYTVYIRTGSHAGVLVDTLSVDALAGGQYDYRYVFAFSALESGSVPEREIDVISQNFNLNLPVTDNAIFHSFNF